MKLRDWLEREGIKPGDFADRIRCNRTTVLRLARDELWPSRDTAQAIFDATGGDVRPNDFLGVADDPAA